MGDLSHIEVLKELSLLIQQKDAEGDKIATDVLIWAHDKLADKFYPYSVE